MFKIPGNCSEIPNETKKGFRPLMTILTSYARGEGPVVGDCSNGPYQTRPITGIGNVQFIKLDSALLGNCQNQTLVTRKKHE